MTENHLLKDNLQEKNRYSYLNPWNMDRMKQVYNCIFQQNL